MTDEWIKAYAKRKVGLKHYAMATFFLAVRVGRLAAGAWIAWDLLCRFTGKK